MRDEVVYVTLRAEDVDAGSGSVTEAFGED